MSLLFDASLECVDHGNATVLQDINAGSMLAWIYSTDFTSDTGQAGILCKNDNPLNWGMSIDIFDGTLYFQIARATTILFVGATPAQLGTHWAINTWLCGAATWDTAGANTDQHVYSGTINVPLVEPSAYNAQQVGSGTPTSQAANNMTVGGTAVANHHLRGRVALVMLFNKTKTLAELRALQFNPPDPFDKSDPSRVLYVQYGMKGAQTQLDVSGYGNHGTVTGATMDPPVPLPQLWMPRAARTVILPVLFIANVALIVPSPSIDANDHQYARPISDTSVGGWTTETGATTNLYASVDEVAPSDTDYIQSSWAPANDPVTFALSTLLLPQTGTKTLHYRYEKSPAGMPINLTVELLQAGIVVQTWTHTNVTTDWVTADQTVTGVSDYTAALSIRFTANQP